MALRAHLDPDLRLGGPGFKGLSTGTGYDGFVILGMYTSFHLLLHLTNRTGRATAHYNTALPAWQESNLLQIVLRVNWIAAMADLKVYVGPVELPVLPL